MLLEQPIHWFSLSLGGWLFVSRFAWAHSESQFANTWLVSVVYTSLAVAAVGLPRVRYLNLIVALWLLVSVWILPRAADATLWNNLSVALGMIGLAVVGLRSAVHCQPA
jgi:hypothetical protein